MSKASKAPKLPQIPKVTRRWTMRDGTKIRVCDMDDSHLVNTIKMLERVARLSRERDLSLAYSASSMIQGEMASMDCDRIIDQLESDPDGEDYMPPIYDDLKMDAMRRGLTI